MISREAKQPDVSVVIVNYNVKDFLFNCLQSLRDAFATLEGQVIVVDNNSQDGSVEYLAPLFPEVEFIRQTENLGFGKANNIGFERCRGEFVLCLNPDTLVSEDTMDHMVDYMRRHPKVGLSGCKLLNHDGSFQLPCRRGFPTPWVSFTKIFGLQSLFPKSRLFGQYNQTFRDVNETYPVDAVAGAFMFMRREALEQTGGFDPDYYMYGEDLDLCYRVGRAGWQIVYVHSTSVIHFKGESTRRSSLNEVREFYRAMEVFVNKHFGSSKLFLLFLRLGITVRSFIAYVWQYRAQWGLALADFALANAALMMGIKIRTGSFLGFPAYAYPEIPLIPAGFLLVSLLYAGEYSIYHRSSIRNLVTALMISFFLLSTVPYFVEDYAISRGVLLMFLGLSFAGLGALRLAITVFEKLLGRDADKRIAIVGVNDVSRQLMTDLQTAEARNTDLVGFVNTQPGAALPDWADPVLGNISYLNKIVRDYGIDELIVTDGELSRTEMLRHMTELAGHARHWRFAHSYDEVITSRIIESLTGVAPAAAQYKITRPGNRLAKRLIDICGSLFLLTIGLPIVYLTSADPKVARHKLVLVLKGDYSLFGIYPLEGDSESKIGKIGLTGLAHINKAEKISIQALRSLNDYYLRHYSLALDFEIFVKYFFRRNSGVG